MVAASAAITGRRAEAQQAMQRLHRLDSALRISDLKTLFPIRLSEDFTRWVEALRKAGLPE
jgi:hypothetical protein